MMIFRPLRLEIDPFHRHIPPVNDNNSPENRGMNQTEG
jgi:hypothetical protein